MTTTQVGKEYIYPVSLDVFAQICQAVCNEVGGSNFEPNQQDKTPCDGWKFELSGERVLIFTTPWRQPSSQIVDIGYLVLIVCDQNYSPDSGRYFYISMVQIPQNGLWNELTPRSITKRLVEYVRDAFRPQAEKKFQLKEVPTEDAGAWNGGLQALPAVYRAGDWLAEEDGE